MNNQQIEEFLDTQGVFIFKTTCFDAEIFRVSHVPSSLTECITHSISIATPIPAEVFKTLDDGPSILYKQYYKIANSLLDDTAFKLTQKLQGAGYSAFFIPASVFTDFKSEEAHISHRCVAAASGLGWIGKSQMLVTPEYGPAVRLITVLTNAPLEEGRPMENRCNNCMACVDICPVHAITGQGYKRDACSAQLKEFGRTRVGVRICGLCIKACLEKHYGNR